MIVSKAVQDILTDMNLSWWDAHMKFCEKQGWVSIDWEECKTCNRCLGGKG